MLLVLGEMQGRKSRRPLRAPGGVRARRAATALVLGAFVLSPMTCPQSTRAGGGSGGSPPVYDPVLFVHADHLGSTTMLTCHAVYGCEEGSPLAYFRYDAFGRTKAFDAAGTAFAAGTRWTDRLFTGQRLDAEAGLYHFEARFYDPETGGFLTHDRAREDVNPYAYVQWNPVTRIDPDGNLSQLFDAPIDVAFIAYDLYNLTQAIQAGDSGAIATESAALAADVAGVFLPGTGFGLGVRSMRGADRAHDADRAGNQAADAAKGGGKWTKEVIERKAPGADGGSSRHIIENLDGKTNSVTHQVTKDGKVIHQHQTHIGRHGTQRQFPDEWVNHPKVPGGGQ